MMVSGTVEVPDRQDVMREEVQAWQDTTAHIEYASILSKCFWFQLMKVPSS